ncbi:cytochrome P450 [Zopfia rhizophila CBS 207.26]|uniref:Cytochrome P450 n=1 Tax=Zopfia rhizophila CBS 207.26 TaxID=1314779 RepID=A0A6A6DMK7_9PEZI|nr:cytochrome P450 [Zopfia rhizophila CBS 207.26]
MVEDIHFSLLSSPLALPIALLLIVKGFKAFQSLRQNEESKPALAPHSVPLVGHSKMFLREPAKLASIISNSTGFEKIIRFKLPFEELWFARGSSQILQILSDPKTFDFGPMKSMVLQRILGLPDKAVEVANHDDSGVSRKPLPHSNVPPERRFNYLERKATKDFTRLPSHAAFVEHFEENLYQWLDICDIADDWLTFSDLYIFIRDLLFRATSDAFFGPHLLQLSPHLAEDIWKFDANVPFLAKGFPSIFNRQARKVRARCTEAFRKWRSFALNEKADMLPEWNKTSGLKCMSLRKELFENFEEWDDDSCAASDLAVLFGLSSNSIRATFWFFLETLQSKDLFEDAAKEMSSAITAPGLTTPTHQMPPRFDIRRLSQLPLLQSIYSETLRMYVSIMILRTTQQKSKLAEWAVSKGQKFAVCNYSQHMDENLWSSETSGTPPVTPPVTAFWGRRFLLYSDSESLNTRPMRKDSVIDSTSDSNSEDAPRFSTEGFGTKYFPFGFGERICPGRHFAKVQTLLTFALLLRTFEIVLMVPEGWKPSPDMKYFGYGTMPPDMPTPFRIRRRA